MCKKSPFILPILFLLFLFSCRGSPPVPIASPEPLHNSLPSSTPISWTATPNPSPSPLPPASQTPVLLPSATPSPTPAFHLCSPLAWETIPELWEIISDPYNPPPMGRDERHQGVDFSHYSRKGHKTIEGEPVQVVLSGRVSAVIQNRLPYGNMVIIETPYEDLPEDLHAALGMSGRDSIYLLYAHFGHPPLVNLGDPVDCGQEIGDVGMTGYNIVNPHLHLEARLGPPGVTFDSMAYYTTTATEQEMENYRRWRTSGEFRHFDPMKLFELVIRFNP